MSIQLASTTATEAEVREALEAAGQQVESIETFSNEGETEAPPAETNQPKTEKPAASTESLGNQPEEDEEGEIEDASAASEQDGEGKPKKGGRGFQKRINKLETHISERDEKIVELEQQIEELRQLQAKPPEEKKPEAKPEPEVELKPKPKLEDFPDYETFTDALTDWKLDQKELKLQQELDKLRGELTQKDKDREAATAQERADAKANDAWVEKVEAVKADYPDWDEVASQTASDKVAPISPAMANAIWEGDENAPRVLHYLASHPDEAKRVFELTNHKQDATPEEIIRANRAVGREYARIEALVKKSPAASAETPAAESTAAAPAATAPPAKPKPKVSTAPAPITPSKTATAQAAPDSPYERSMSHKEYMEWYARTHPKK